jgi:hypothetical protein
LSLFHRDFGKVKGKTLEHKVTATLTAHVLFAGSLTLAAFARLQRTMLLGVLLSLAATVTAHNW